jgi:hypothetical protein
MDDTYYVSSKYISTMDEIRIVEIFLEDTLLVVKGVGLSAHHLMNYN